VRKLSFVILAGALAILPVPLAAQGDAQHSGQMPDHMDHSFADAEEYAKSFDDPARDSWQMPDRVVAALQLKPGQSVADIGSGTGYFSVRLAKTPAAPKVFAVDIEPNMVEYVRHRAMHEGLTNIVAIKASADRSNLPEPVDVVLIVDTYHHLPNRVAYFTALKGLMKPGAKLAIVDFRKDAPGQGPPQEFRFTPAQISAELGKAGFVLQQQYDFLPRQLFLIYGVK
jgi:cyclopropane fatty-acyl-phospholipid synthase-like methyltransferase